jgi:ABC-type ATPase with predicted acetyltransferase domain
MQNFNIVKQTLSPNTFRTNYVASTYDLNLNNLKQVFSGALDIDFYWNIGLIVGNSGTGKSTIAKELFPDNFIEKLVYKSNSLLDDFPENATVKEICIALSSVGFSTPPSWLKPYSVLSNGEKMRCDIARVMLENDFAVYDEFTSVIDRNVAKIGSFAIQKYIRKANKKFIAVTCHHDVEDWLLPDWVLNTDNMEFIKKKNLKDQKLNATYTKSKKKNIIGNFLESIII